MTMEYIVNGQGVGQLAQVLLNHRMDSGAMRPFIGDDGRAYVTLVQRNQDGSVKLHTADTIRAYGKQNGIVVNDEQIHNLLEQRACLTMNQLVTNAPAFLRKDEWVALDKAVLTAAKPRMKAWADLRSFNQYVIPQGMGKLTFEYETMTDITGADVSMDAIKQADADRPLFSLKGLPLPIFHKQFHFSSRQVMASQANGSQPIDTINAGLAGEKVAEEVEKGVIGTSAKLTALQYAGNQVYGYTNFPQRLTKVITTPVTGGWVPETTLTEILQMRALAKAQNQFGPFKCYMGSDWDTYLDKDYSATKGQNTLRERIGQINGISVPETLDYLPGYQILLVQQSVGTARAVVAMEMRTIQWVSHGGMQVNYMVMCIMIPQLRADGANQCGIVHGS